MYYRFIDFNYLCGINTTLFSSLSENIKKIKFISYGDSKDKHSINVTDSIILQLVPKLSVLVRRTNTYFFLRIKMLLEMNCIVFCLLSMLGD